MSPTLFVKASFEGFLPFLLRPCLRDSYPFLRPFSAKAFFKGSPILFKRRFQRKPFLKGVLSFLKAVVRDSYALFKAFLRESYPFCSGLLKGNMIGKYRGNQLQLPWTKTLILLSKASFLYTKNTLCIRTLNIVVQGRYGERSGFQKGKDMGSKNNINTSPF